MNREAWLVLYIDRKTRVVNGAGVFSEPSPTANSRFCTVPLFSEEASEYHIARRMVVLRLDSPEYRWVLPLLDESVLDELAALRGAQMTTKAVDGCKECPLLQRTLGPQRFCNHPDHSTATLHEQRAIDFLIVVDGGAPDWCPLLDGPLLVQRK